MARAMRDRSPEMVPNETFQKWKTEFDPKDQWLTGFVPKEDEKKIARISCSVCENHKDELLRVFSNSNDDFAEGKGDLTEECIRNHAEEQSHKLALSLEKNESALECVAKAGNRSLAKTEGALTPFLPRETPGPGDVTNIALEKGVVLSNVTGSLTFNISHNTQNSALTKPLDEISLIAETLKKSYAEMNSRIVVPCLRSESLDLHDIYYKLDIGVRVLNADHTLVDPPDHHTNLEYIFDRVKGLKTTRIVLQDCDGFLSSMVLFHLCCSWSSSEGLASFFDLVVYLDGQRLKSESLQDLIIERCRTEGVEDHLTLKTIENNPKILLILDDLPSDLPRRQEIPLSRLLRSPTYEEITVLVSTRKMPTTVHLNCTSNSTCLKIGTVHKLNTDDRIQFMCKNLPYQANELPRSVIKKKLEQHYFLKMQPPIFSLLLFYVFLKEKFPSEQNTDTEIYKIIFKRLVSDHFGCKGESLYNFEKNSVTPAGQLLSRIGDYVLTNLASGNSSLNLQDMKEHFQGELNSVLKFGFVVAKFQSPNQICVEKVYPVSQCLWHFLIAYHIRAVCKTHPTQQVLQKIDLVNQFQPLDENFENLISLCFVDLLDDVEKIYHVVRQNRPQYKTLIEILDTAVQRKKILELNTIGLMTCGGTW